MSIRFNASGDALTRTTNLPSPLSTSPLSVFFRFYRVTGSRYSSTFSLLVTAGHAIFIDSQSSNVITAGFYDGATTVQADSAAISDATWYDIAAVWNDSTNTIDIYTALRSDAGFTKVTQSGAWAWVGTPDTMKLGNSVFDEWTDGRFSDIKIWQAALTQTELENERFSILPRRTNNLHAFYPTFPNTTERARDYSGNEYNWTEGGTLTDESDPGNPTVPWGYTFQQRSILGA